MKPWPLFTLFLLIQQTASHGQGVENTIRKGNDALADGLWEVAEMHFRQCLDADELSSELKSQVALRLAESLVRAGNAAGALEVLGHSYLEKNPETTFWKAQALAGQNRLSDAAELFSSLLVRPDAPYRAETGFTLAGIQLSLDQPEAALETLSKLVPEADAATVVRIQLHRVEILLDLDRTAQARLAMPARDSLPAKDRPLAAFLEAELLLKEEHPAEAQVAFQELVNQPDGQSLERHDAAVIGLADAIADQGNKEVASKSLLTFIQDNPGTPLLESMFSRIVAWLPEKPTATDAVLERISQWITPPVFPGQAPINTLSTSAVDPVFSYAENAPPADRLVYSLYARAIGLHRVGTPEARAESLRLLNRLRVENPAHVLAERALYQQARWLLDDGSIDKALSLLDTIRDTSASPVLKGESAFLEAKVSYQNGDPQKAIRLFDEAAKSLEAPRARAARLQSAITRFRSGDPRGVKLIQQEGTARDGELETDLELERALSAPVDTKKTALAEFIKKHPDHPRISEARLAAAEAALTGPATDPAFALTQLDVLAAHSDNEDAIPPQRLALARLRAIDLSKDPAATMIAAQAIMDNDPADPAAAEAALTLGRNLFQTGSYNQARLVLEKLASSDTDTARAQAAWLLAARSAALGGTPQSKEQAIILFDNAIKGKGPVTSLATLEKARHLIDLRQMEAASALLEKWIKTLPENDPLQLPAGLLFAESLSQGSTDTASLLKALTVYDKMVAHAKEHPALFNRLQYLRGKILEILPDPKDPNKKREREAFQAYLSVLEIDTAPAEWEYFDRCGFSALALLEKSKRWEAAIAVAKKIAVFQGPGAEEATNRVRKLQLEHKIWED